MRILLFKTWITNIGNAFIDKGAKKCLEKAFPNAEIIEVSGFPNMTVMTSGTKFFARYIGDKIGKLGKPLIGYGNNKMKGVSEVNNFINIGEMLDADLAVISGRVLDIHLEWYMKTLKKVVDAGIPLILLGAGGLNYNQETQKRVKDCFNRIKFRALFTRDSTAYKSYSKYFNYSYDGIDCGFFINDWYNPPKTKEQFLVSTFDKMREPIIDTEYDIIRPHHEALIPTFSGFMTAIGLISIIRLRLKCIDFLKKPNFFVSDSLEDYLFLYSNAKEVHSDRVHACVAALAYGTPARFYIKTHRSKLFDRIGMGDISNQIMFPNKDRIENEKKMQVLALKRCIEDL